MMPSLRRTWLAVLCLAAHSTIASGQEVSGATGAINDTTPTSSQDEITVHYIDVSNRTHYFTPNSINARPGDIVSFKFWPGNHSVIRSEYGYPCVPYEDFEGNEGAGFYSGVMSPDDNDVKQGNVSKSGQRGINLRLMLFTAPDLELDHKYDCTNVLLLWCTR